MTEEADENSFRDAVVHHAVGGVAGLLWLSGVLGSAFLVLFGLVRLLKGMWLRA